MRIPWSYSWTLLGVALLLPFAMEYFPGTKVLPDYGLVPDFHLVERSGREVRRAELAGAPWVADFIFTRCSGSCPALSARMTKLQDALGDRVRMVTFSVDPEHDTPRVLSEYASRLGASNRWLFITGDTSELRKLVTDGFHLSAVEKNVSAAEPLLTHSDRFALVDENLHIRQYYLGTEDGCIDQLRGDLESLATR